MSLSDKVASIRSHLETAQREVQALEGGKKASAPRARKSLQEVKKLSHELRKVIVEHLKSVKGVKEVKVVKEVKPAETLPPPPPSPEPPVEKALVSKTKRLVKRKA